TTVAELVKRIARQGRLTGHAATQEAEPLPHARMVLRRPRNEFVLASLAAEAQAPMTVADEPEPAPTVGAAVLRLGHEARLRVGGWSRRAHHARTTGTATAIVVAGLPHRHRGPRGNPAPPRM